MWAIWASNHPFASSSWKMLRPDQVLRWARLEVHGAERQSPGSRAEFGEHECAASNAIRFGEVLPNAAGFKLSRIQLPP